MDHSVKIHRENYSFLPERFIRKIEYDLNYIQERKIPGLRQIYLFGSCARGEVRSTSDVDLLIITDNKIKDRALAADSRRGGCSTGAAGHGRVLALPEVRQTAPDSRLCRL